MILDDETSDLDNQSKRYEPFIPRDFSELLKPINEPDKNKGKG
jgi:hypothetical protein